MFSFAVAGIGASAIAAASSRQLPDEVLHVEFGLLFDEAEPVSGHATSTIGQKCELLNGAGNPLSLTLLTRRERGSIVNELIVACEKDCSFSNGRSLVTFDSDRQFDLFAGSDSITIPLVFKPRTRIGQILLIFR